MRSKKVLLSLHLGVFSGKLYPPLLVRATHHIHHILWQFHYAAYPGHRPVLVSAGTEWPGVQRQCGQVRKAALLLDYATAVSTKVNAPACPVKPACPVLAV
ncbi:hypothetical protein BBAD15_g12131 [Beauveria bassiana D1-5]|uniref:Uncharacterized protein n=1 Tax=Beauveria bassiana D1-5 TaxID=1245745 RepID=A0A0A2V9C6_BEABA|nr:hypothetical protein BBAD15_g12131 [Beauveria bassiana D1-5]